MTNKKFIYVINTFIIAIVAILCSCNNEEAFDDNNHESDFKVCTMGQFTSVSRSTTDFDLPILQFKDEASYSSVVNKLKNMSEEERTDFLKKHGFENAEMFYTKADKELDELFEINDSSSFVKALNDFKVKYKKFLSLNNNNKYDVTPHLFFNDTDRMIVGNQLGYVVIGNKIQAPKNSVSNVSRDVYQINNDGKLAKAPIENKFIPFEHGSMLVKNGKIRSFFNVGTIHYSGTLAVKLKSLKKNFVWNKEVKYVHQVDFEIKSSKYNNRFFVSKDYGYHEQDLFVPLRTVGDYGTKFDVNVIKFTINNKNKDNTLSPLSNSGSGLLKDVIFKQ